jgi:hypothetical protein
MTDPVLKIEGYAFDKFLFMRDHKEFEVTMFGITKPEDPLHVVDFKLVKQVVNSASSDCDQDYMCEYNERMYLDHGILPINCERIWCHTHPMTGETSANPSGKDMSTWNDKDNELKQFLVMLILSRSNHITCKLRIKSNLGKVIPSVDIPIAYEKDIKVEILKDETYSNKIKESLVSIFGQTCVDKLGDNAIKILKPTLSLIEIYPEFSELVTEYDKLVSEERRNTIYSWNNNTHTTVTNNGGPFLREKKEPVSGENVPEILLRISEHRISVNNLQPTDLATLASSFSFESQKDIDSAQLDFEKIKNEKTNITSVFLAAISANILTVRNSITSIDCKSTHLAKRCKAVNFARLPFPEFHASALEINKQLLEKSYS